MSAVIKSVLPIHDCSSTATTHAARLPCFFFLIYHYVFVNFDLVLQDQPTINRGLQISKRRARTTGGLEGVCFTEEFKVHPCHKASTAGGGQQAVCEEEEKFIVCGAMYS